MKRPTACILVVSGLCLGCRVVAAADSLDLKGTTITGNRELPKALHIVPWKAATPGELAGRPMQSLVDEVMAPVDRDVMRRELEYYDSVHISRQGSPVELDNGDR